MCVFVLCCWISAGICISEACPHPVTKKDSISPNHNRRASIVTIHITSRLRRHCWLFLVWQEHQNSLPDMQRPSDPGFLCCVTFLELLCRQGLLEHLWFPNCYCVVGVSGSAVPPCLECLPSSCPCLTASPTTSSFRICTNPALSPTQVFSSYLEPKPAAPCVLIHLALGSIHLCCWPLLSPLSLWYPPVLVCLCRVYILFDLDITGGMSPTVAPDTLPSFPTYRQLIHKFLYPS